MKTWVWLCLLSPALWGQPTAVEFRVDPPETRLSIHSKDIPASRPGLFTIGQEDLGANSESKVPFHFHLPGWKSVEPLYSWRDVKGMAQSPPEVIVLEPDSAGAYLRRYPVPAAGLGVVALLSLVFLVRGGRRSHQVQARENQRQSQTATAHQVDPFLGRSLGGYRITHQLGAGGMANVYQGERGREVAAIKVIRPEERSQEFDLRFQREIEVSRRLEHPNVVRVLSWGCEGEIAFLAMEFVPGSTLQNYITPGGMAPSEVRRILPQLVAALSYAHAQGVVHRDLKPANVMLDGLNRLKLMDFGLARSQQVNTVTLTGKAIGTPAYLAPEQFSSGPHKEKLTPLSDQYSLGVLLFECLTGRVPFEGHDPIQVVLQHLNEPPPSLRAIRPDLSQSLEKALERMLSKKPEDRFADVQQAGLAVLEALA